MDDLVPEYSDQELHYAAAQARLDKSREKARRSSLSAYGDDSESLAIIYLADVLREAFVKP